MRTTLTSLLLAATIAAPAQVLWEFPGLSLNPCSNWLQPCDSAGCSVCNTPVNTPTMIGTNVVWLNLTECPGGDPFGDGYVMTYGWTDTSRILTSMIVLADTYLDSIVVGGGFGPIVVEVELNNAPFVTLHNGPAPALITDLGCLAADGGLGTMQVRITALDGWKFDHLRIYGTPCAVGVREWSIDQEGPEPWRWDLIGREIPQDR